MVKSTYGKRLLLLCAAGLIPILNLTFAAPAGQDLRERAWQIVEQTWLNGPAPERFTMTGQLWRLDDPRAHRLLASALKDVRRGARLPAATALRSRPFPDLVNEMAAALATEEDYVTRMFLIDAIVASGHPLTPRLLAPSIRDPHPKVRMKVLGELENLGDLAIEVWSGETSNRNAETRARAVTILGKRGNKARLEAALADPDATVRKEAACVLASEGDPRAVPELNTILGGAPPQADRFRAAQALSRLGDARGKAFLEGALQSSDALMRARAASMLFDARLPQTGMILASMLNRDPDPQVRFAALNGLLQIGGEEGTRALEAALNDPDEWNRVYVARKLLAKGDPRGKRIFQSAFGSGGLSVRVAASEDLAKYLSEGESGFLVGLLHDPIPVIRKNAMKAASRIRASTLLPDLREVLMEPNVTGDVRMTAAAAIGDIGGPEAERILRDALDAEDPTIRVVAAIAILRPAPAGAAREQPGARRE